LLIFNSSKAAHRIFFMQPLKLNPLPCVIPSEETPFVIRDDCGFVDEAAVRAQVAGPIFSQQFENMRPDLSAMTENELDYAGWCLSAATVASGTRSADRRPGLPMLAKPGAGDSNHGPLRCWLSGMAGAACSLLFALILLPPAAHRFHKSEPFATARPPTTPSARIGRDEPARRKAVSQWTRLNPATFSGHTTGD
jgi:hypothetical protein